MICHEVDAKQGLAQTLSTSPDSSNIKIRFIANHGALFVHDRPPALDFTVLLVLIEGKTRDVERA